MELARVLKRTVKPGIQGDMVVLGLPDGGICVAAAAARFLGFPLYPLVVRKLGIPGHDSLSMGAVAPQGVQWLDRDLIKRLGIAEAIVQKAVQKEALELQQTEHIYRKRHDFGVLAGKAVVIVDDGIADHAHNILAAIEFLRRHKPRLLVIAAPVISVAAVAQLADKCQDLVCLHQPDNFIMADYWYEQQLIRG